MASDKGLLEPLEAQYLFKLRMGEDGRRRASPLRGGSTCQLALALPRLACGRTLTLQGASHLQWLAGSTGQEWSGHSHS